MKKRGSIKLTKKGLLHLAKNFKKIVRNELSDTNEVDVQIQSSLIDMKKNDIKFEDMGEDHSEYTGFPCATKMASEEVRGKLIPLAWWKKEKSSKMPREHELVSFLKWKGQSEEKYEGIKKTSKVLLSKLDSCQENDEVELVEENSGDEGLEILPFEEENTESDFRYSYADLAYGIRNEMLIAEVSSSKERTLEKSGEITKNQSYSRQAEEWEKIKLKRRRSGIFADVFTVIFCLVGALMSISVFYDSFNRTLTKIDEEPIAVITFKYNSAQRKLSDRILWDRVKQDTPVYNGDIIRTADLSEATIRFLDGNTINLYEKSLVQVFYSDSGANIDFSAGEISINTTTSSPGLNLTSEGNSISLEADTILIANIDAEIVDGQVDSASSVPLVLQVSEGVATITEDNQLAELVVSAGEAVIVAESGIVQGRPSVSVISPTPNAKYLRQMNESAIVEISWVVPSDAVEQYVFELSRQKSFSRLEQRQDVTDISSLKLNLTDGLWYWRIYSSEPEDGRTGKFRVIESVATELIRPTQNEQIGYTSLLPTVRFVWSDNKYAAEWKLEVSDSESMQDPVVSQIIGRTSSVINTLGEGKWYWQVTPIYLDGVFPDVEDSSVSSPVQVFDISLHSQITSVNLLSPQVDSFINKEEKQYFSWEFSDEADFYTIKISENADMRRPIIEHKTEENYYIDDDFKTKFEDGLWYWSVTKTDGRGRESSIGEIRPFWVIDGEFSYSIKTPPNNEIRTESTIGETLFIWENNIPYDTYFQVAADAGFTDVIINQKTEGASITGVSIPVGKWYWRINSIHNETQKEISTKGSVLYVDNTPGEVVLLKPAADSVSVVAPNNPIEFSWVEVDQADYYEIKIYSQNTDEDLVYENLNVSDNSTVVHMNDLLPGRYRCSLVAVILENPSGKIQKGDIAEYAFSTRNIEPILLQGPRDGYSIDGVTALTSPPSVLWTSSEKVKTAEFVLSGSERILNNALRQGFLQDDSSQIIFRVDNPSTTVTLPPLKSGTWYWTVFGTSEEGYNISSSQVYSIVVESVDKLASTVNMHPSDNTLYNAEYLSNNNYIDFSWERVAQANYYLFELRNESGEIIIKEQLEEPFYQLTDLQLLDRGRFTWTIEAQRLLPQGIEQEGIVVSSSFIIDLPQLQTPQGKTTGDLYGL